MMAHDPSLLAAGAALHALDPEELAGFEAHVLECATCAAELSEFRETAARLGAAEAMTPPASLRAAVMARIPMTRQLPPEVGRAAQHLATAVGDELAARRTRRPRTGWLLAAAIAAIAIVTSVFIISRDGTEPDQAAVLRQCISTASDRQSPAPTGPSVGTAAVTVSRSCGAALIQMKDMPAAPTGSTYQYWAMAGDEARSLGIGEPDSAGAMRDVVAQVEPEDTSLGVTVEPDGGSAGPTGTPLVLIPLS
jgi:anti-sigma-K factor RskA